MPQDDDSPTSGAQPIHRGAKYPQPIDTRDRIVDLLLAEGKPLTDPVCEAVVRRLPGRDIDEALVAENGQRESGLAERVDFVGKAESPSVVHDAIGEDRPGCVQLEGVDAECSETVDFALREV